MPKIEIEISEELKAFLDKEGVEVVRFGTVKKEESFVVDNGCGQLSLGVCTASGTLFEYLVVRKKLKLPPFLEHLSVAAFSHNHACVTLFDEKGEWCGRINISSFRPEDFDGFKSNTIYYKKNCI